MKRYPSPGLMLAMATLISVSACDSGPSIPVPAITDVSVGEEPLVFVPGEALPRTSIRVLLDGSADGLTAEWTSDGGKFQISGTSSASYDASLPVLWTPNRAGRTYNIEVTVTNGSSGETGSTTIDVEPSIAGHWLGTIDVADESADRAGFCMWIRNTNELGIFRYGQTLGSAGTTNGGNDVASTYDFPDMTLDLNASGSTGGIDSDDAISAVGIVDADGLGIEVVVKLGDGTMRTIPLERFAGLCDELGNEIRGQ